MPTVEAEIADVGVTCFADPQTVESEQHPPALPVMAEMLGGEQEPAEFGAVHSVSV